MDPVGGLDDPRQRGRGGESFHITSHEVLTWNQITETVAAAAGLEARVVHVPSDFIAAIDPEIGDGLLGDNGAPGLRRHYHVGYYATFVLDPDGYNIEAVWHGTFAGTSLEVRAEAPPGC